MKDKSIQDLWQDYRFLTKEMMKFITKGDMDLFYNLMNQREKLQSIIDKTSDDGYKLSPEGKSLLTEIQQDNQEITYNLQVLIGKVKQKQKVSEAYRAVSTTTLSRMNWNR